MSPDLCEHSVARFFESVLGEHDRSRFEVTCYADVPHPDAHTDRLRQLSDRWRDSHGWMHQQLADRVREDGIDILVDLAGHTANNRMPVFSCRPAPVQVTWLGYPNTTGVPAIEYRITDARADPPGATDEFHTETLVRLPACFINYHPPDNAPAVGALPALSGGEVTFGSFNNLAKTTPAVIRTWSGILAALPGARLLLKSRGTADPDVRQRLHEQFSEHGIAADRIVFHSAVPSFQGHMAVYNQVDIGLDTFPYNGTTTTCEALWMGVPVIALAGKVHAARVGVSLLHAAGMDDLVAGDTDQYIELAVRLAGDTGRLASLREQLRGEMRDSSLCDNRGFTRDLETALRDMWGAWCRGRAGE